MTVRDDVDVSLSLAKNGEHRLQTDAQLIDTKHFNPFLLQHPTLENARRLLFETDCPRQRRWGRDRLD